MTKRDNVLVALFKLTRFEHSIMLVVAVLAAELIAGGLPIAPILALSLVSPIFNSAGAFAINDYFDVETDRMNGMVGRPLVSGSLGRRTAFGVAAFCCFAAVVMSAFINAYAFVIMLLFAALSYYYSARLKDLPLVGNLYVALSYAIPFVFGAVVVSDSVSPVIWLVFFVALLSGLGREVHGAIRDREGDAKTRGTKNIVYHLGEKKSAYFAFVLYAEAIAISEFLFVYKPIGIYTPFAFNAVYIVPITVANLALFYVAAKYMTNPTKGFHGLARNLSLGAMALALITYLAAALLPFVPV